MKITAYVSHFDCSRHDTGWNHPEHQGRLPAVARAVHQDMLTLFEPLLEVEATPASTEDLLLAHAPAYVERVRHAVEKAGHAGESMPFEAEVMLSGASWEAAVAAAGSVLTGVEQVLSGTVRNACSVVRPPGHLAGRAQAGGFCIFNNVAIAALHLRDRHHLDRVLIVEWSARGGQGTAEIVAAEPGIRFLSVHEQTTPEVDWPGAARVVALPSGTGGGRFREAAEAALDEAVADFAPDFILLSLGLDALSADPLGGLALEPHDFYELTAMLRARAESLCGGRLVSVLEGGYDAAATSHAVVQHLRALALLPPV